MESSPGMWEPSPRPSPSGSEAPGDSPGAPGSLLFALGGDCVALSSHAGHKARPGCEKLALFTGHLGERCKPHHHAEAGTATPDPHSQRRGPRLGGAPWRVRAPELVTEAGLRTPGLAGAELLTPPLSTPPSRSPSCGAS